MGLDIPQLATFLRGWINPVRYGDTWGLRRALLAAYKFRS